MVKISSNVLDFIKMILPRVQEVASMRKYCEQCGKEIETKVISKRESYNVCGELIEYTLRS